MIKQIGKAPESNGPYNSLNDIAINEEQLGWIDDMFIYIANKHPRSILLKTEILSKMKEINKRASTQRLFILFQEW